MLIGSPLGDRVEITVLGRMHPGATDFDDGNWLYSPVDVVVGGFKGHIPAGLRAEELRGFREELVKAYEDFGGVARLESLEEWLSLTATVHRSGRIEVRGVARDQPGSANTLTFLLDDLDQTDLPPIIDALTAIGEAFPVLGEHGQRGVNVTGKPSTGTGSDT
ncbi:MULTISPECIES: WapI family immunity protein [Amycolatopsis]|uniref:WapI family immunity protein n=1 Tax=Amycolatopsis TaxID=1813 RepID=UPI0031F736EC